MCRKLEKIIQLARVTFDRSKTSPEFNANLHKNVEILSSKVQEITGIDVGLEKSKVMRKSNERQKPQNTQAALAPVTYIPITESKDYSIGIFIIRSGQKIPLHDHPRMHGILKCLHGQLKISSFTRKTDPSVKPPDKWMKSPRMTEKLNEGEIFLTSMSPVISMTPESKAAILEPGNFNIHQIESIGGTAAFLDILAPPYNADPGPEEDEDQELRDCHYFVDLGSAGESYRWLKLSEPPLSFYCDTELYQGPDITSE